MPLAITMLGGFRVQCGEERRVVDLPSRPVASLFAYLLVHPGYVFQRAELAPRFWPDVPSENARGSLREALRDLRALFETWPEDKRQRFVSNADHSDLCLQPGPNWWVDIWAVEEALATAEHQAPGSPEWFAALERAASLYGGRLLPDLEEEWCYTEQDRLQVKMLEAIYALARAYLDREQYDKAGRWGRRGLEIEPADEACHRVMIELYLQRRQLAQAMRQYSECRRLLEELDSLPDDETQALYQEIERRLSADAGVPVPPVPPLPGWGGPMVGRERELHALQTAWHQARNGAGSLVLISGELGIGKSRLGLALIQEATRTGALALYAPAFEAEAPSLYQPLIDPLRRARRRAERDGLEVATPTWLAQLAPITETERGGTGRGPAFSSPPGSVEGLCQYFVSYARQLPVCLFLDDLQWADAGTGRLLHALAARAPEEPILLLASYREGEVAEAPWLGSWLTEVEGQRLATHLSLSRFEAEESLQLLSRLAGGGASDVLLERLARRLHREGEGNPLILLETLRQWYDAGMLTITPRGRWSVNPEKASPAPLPAPARVQELMQRRVARLGPEDRELLECAAVIGRRFSYETLQGAAGREPQAVLAALHRLLAGAFIVAHPQGAAFDFQHARLREVVYRDLPAGKRRELHRRVGEALEVRYGMENIARMDPRADVRMFRYVPRSPLEARAEEGAAELARHFERIVRVQSPGGDEKSASSRPASRNVAARADVTKAALYTYVAGRRARALMDFDQAVRYLERARALADRALRESVEADPSDPAEAQAALELMGEIIEQLAPSYRGVGRLDDARALLETHIHRCQRERHPLGVARGLTLLANLIYLNPGLGPLAESLGLNERAIAVCEQQGLKEWAVFPRCHLAYDLAEEGRDLPRAEALLAACRPDAEGRGDTVLWQRILTAEIWIATWRGDWQALRELFEASLSWGGPQAEPIYKLLTVIEERCHQAGALETFQSLCREMAAGYRLAGMESPLAQWYLEPASVYPASGRPRLRETFDKGALPPTLTWQVPPGATRIDWDTRPGWLEVRPDPDADLWPDMDMNAPRFLTPLPDGGVAEVRVDLDWERCSFAGLFLWQDTGNFVRLELRRRLWEPAAVHMQANVAGRFRQMGRGRWEQKPTWLRLERSGDEVRGLCSTNKKVWWRCGAFRLPRAEGEQVGVAVVADGQGGGAWIDTFLIWRA
jgi:DNA-binding SARP family transcriptional activator